MREAIEAFEQDFAQWDLHLPADAITTKRGGQIRDAGWSIRYNFGTDARGEYLDYYATGHAVVDNPPGDDLHVRIYATGERVALPTVLEAYMYGRDPTWEELERARRKYEDQLGASPGAAVAAKAPPAEAPKPLIPHPTAPQHPPTPSVQRGVESIADAGVVGLPPLDAPDTYLALDIGLDLDLDIDLDPRADEPPPPPEADLDAAAAALAAPALALAPEAPPSPAPDPVALEDDLTPRQPVEMVDVVLADDWTITTDQTAAWDSPGRNEPPGTSDTPAASDPTPADRSKGALSGFPPEERAAIEIDASAPPRPSLDEVQEGDLVMFIPTSRVSIETNPADIPEAHEFVEDATAAIMSAPPTARTEPPSGRPTSQPPAEAVAALAGFGIGGTPPRREPPAKPAPRGKPGGASRVSTAAPSRAVDNQPLDVDDLDDSGLPVDAEMFKPWWFRSGGRRKAMIIAATVSVLLAIGLVLAHVMHWPLPGSASSDAAQAVDSVNAASAADHPDTADDSAESTEATPAGTTAGADSETGAGTSAGASGGAAAGTPAAGDNTTPAGSAPGEGGIVKPAGPNSVPAIVPSRRPGARSR